MKTLCLILGLFVSSYAFGVGPTIVGKSGVEDIKKGVTDASDAHVGEVGEYKELERVSSIAVTTDVWHSVDPGNSTFNDGNETGLTLTPGDWDISGSVLFAGVASTSLTRGYIGIGTAKGTTTTGVAEKNSSRFQDISISGTPRFTLVTPTFRVSISNTTTYYLKSNSTFTVSTLSEVGTIRARRVR